MPENSVRPSDYSNYLRSFGCHSAAERADDPGYHLGYIWRSTGKRRVRFVPFDSMLRTDPKHAKQLAEAQYKRLLPLRSIIKESFAFVTFSTPITEDPRDGKGKGFIYSSRDVIRQVVPISVSKAGTRGNRFVTVKCLSTLPLDEDDIRALESIRAKMPPGTRLTYKNYSSDQFEQQLRKLTAPDLPDDDLARAKFECILKRVDQIVVHSKICSTVCEIHKPHKHDGKVLGEDFIPPRKNALPDRMIDPETHEPASAFIRMSMHRKIEDVESWEFTDYPDVEESDCTTPTESAAMLAECG